MRKITRSYDMFGFIKKRGLGSRESLSMMTEKITYLCDSLAEAKKNATPDEEIIKVTVSYTVED